MDSVKLYLLAPHYDIPADGPLVLGTIISDVRDPDSLNEGALVEISPSSIYTTHKYDWDETVESNQGANASVCARYLSAFFGGGLGGHWDAKSIIHFRFPDLETTYFKPSQEYVKNAVSKHKVRAYLEGSRFTPVYMITGLKIGRGSDSQITSSSSYTREAHINTGLSANVAGYPFVIDTGGMSVHQTGGKGTMFRGGSNFVIAYRLAKITFQQKADGTHASTHENYTVGALLGEDDDLSRDDELSLSVRVDGDDAVADELCEEKLVMAIDEDDNHECMCFIVPPAEDQTP